MKKNKNIVEWVVSHPGTGERIVRDTFEECMEKDFEGFNPPFRYVNGKREDISSASKRVKKYLTEKLKNVK
jgi:hypothetical protein